ncbi:MAG: WYL domain-containing protein, partial [Clostridia bacterium]|nr:WYL domain-containing protein [Clostridia bacterium]
MYAQQPKKMLVMNILEILKKYTDEDHRLSQKDIIEILTNEYGMTADRKAVRRNLTNLMEAGYEIEYSESIRMTPNPKTGELEESVVTSDYYLVREFTDAELRLLIDGLLFSKHVPYAQCKELVEKLEGLSNKYFQARVKHIRTLPDRSNENKQLFYTIEVLDEAISGGKQVAFRYLSYGLDKKQHPRKDKNGNVREYVTNPYQIAAANGRYYLICNLDGKEDVSNYRLDRIADIRLLDSPAKPARKVKDLKNGMDLPKHMAEHIYMFPGESAQVTFRFKKYLINDVMDWFGNDIRFFDETEDEATARVTVNLEAMRHWAMQYARHVTVLSPQSLADTVAADLKEAAENY